MPARLLLVLLATATLVEARPAWACSVASQRQRYLLGRAERGLVVLELDLRRDDVMGKGGAPMSIRWRGTARLTVVPAGGTAVAVGEAAKVETADAQFESAMKPIFAAALKAAGKLPGFAPAPLPSYTFCDFKKRCGPVTMSTAKGELTLGLSHAGRTRRVRVELPREVIDAMIAATGGNPREATKQERAEALEAFALGHLFQYRLGAESLWVASFGTGGRKFAWPELRAWPPRGCKELAACPPFVMTLHHGTHFDLLVPFGPAAAAPATPGGRR